MPVRRFASVAPVDLGRTIARMAAGRGDPSFAFDDGAWMATRIGGEPVTLRFTRDGPDIVAEAWGAAADDALARAPTLCGAEDDPTGFAPDHPVLRDLHRRFPGIRVTRTGLVVEALLRTIVGQRVTGREAKAAYARMTRALGDRAPGPRPLVTPPDPGRVAATGYPSFHPWGIERSRAEILIRVAGRATRMEETAAMPLDAAYARLRAVTGIGPWTAGKVGAVVFGDADAVPVGDYHLPNTVASALVGEDRADDDRMLALLEPFRPHRARVIALLEAAHLAAPKFGPRTPITGIRDK